jgi:hypothetical protein
LLEIMRMGSASRLEVEGHRSDVLTGIEEGVA